VVSWLKGHWIAIAAGLVGLAVGGGIGVAGAEPSVKTVVSAVTKTIAGPTKTRTEHLRPTVTRTETDTSSTTETSTETTTVTTTVITDIRSPTSCNGADPCPPRGPSGADGTYNCSDFDTQQQAQTYFDQVGDIDGLDANHDGVPCESLP
jgi:hypothetical protein